METPRLASPLPVLGRSGVAMYKTIVERGTLLTK